MNPSKQIAKHFREVYFGGNWTCSSLKDNLEGITWEQATTKIGSFNTIATLVYHISYYVDVVSKVLQGEPLSGSDKLSFEHPPINSQEDWDSMLNRVWANAENFAGLIGQLPGDKLWKNFTEEKYGIYYRHLHGIIEHTHYHLGQIAILKKILQQQS